jgi:hypothetical protein
MVRTQIQLTEAQARTLKSLAATQGTSVADLVRQAVEQLIQTAGPVDVVERRRRAIAAAGRFNSGLADVSEEHDRYLLEAYQA